MKKNNLVYALLLVAFIIAAGLVVVKNTNDVKKNEVIAWQLLARKGSGVITAEWKIARQQADQLQQALKANPADIKSMIALANLFIMEARATGNYTYYDRAAMTYIDDVLKKESDHFEALTLKAMIHLSQHHFSEGLAIAHSAQKINPHNAFLYGVLVDASVELGNYDSAVYYAEKMMSIRPDLRSYARAAYLREIHGDYEGAITAMQLAIDAGRPGDEATEWSRMQLGQLYEHTGDLKDAELCYKISLDGRPGYVHALAGLARIALASSDYKTAISYYQQADSLSTDLHFKEQMAEVYELMGNKEQAATLSKYIIDEMTKNAAKAVNDESIGHYADKELAYAYINTGDLDKALQHALAEYNRRPKNMDVNETLAWVYYKMGNHEKALQYIVPALSTHSQNPALLSRAGLIFESTGDRMKAKQYLEAALRNNPNIAQPLKQETVMALKKISPLAKL